MKKTTAIIVTAGKGKRFGSRKKNYTDLLGMPVIARTVKAFEDAGCIDSIVIVVGPGDIEGFKKEIKTEYGFKKIEKIVEGGKERKDSVKNGFEAVPKDSEAVLIHDGGRPLVTVDLIEKICKKTKESGAAVPGVKVKDTIKEVLGGKITKTVPRENLVSIQTPQGFKVEVLKDAYSKASSDIEATDESMIVEAAGYEVSVVEGSYDNIKVTTPEDIPVAESIIRKRESK